VADLSEEMLAQKVATYKTHETTIDFVLENFDSTTNKYKAMLEK